MTMPTREAYAKAILEPANLALPVLHVMKPTRNSDNSMPRMWPGAFGVVFRFEKSDGTKRALKCFTETLRTRAERYEAVADHLDRVFCHNHPAGRFLVNALYARQGVRVEGHWQPALLMDWVDGVFLHEHVDALCEQPDAQAALTAIAVQWTELALALKSAGIAHGDLHHGNVLVTSAGQMKLIDYDGLCVPALANRYVMEGGHIHYQHPARSLRFDQNLDAFSALVVLTALTAIALKPTLWKEFRRGCNMLFNESDFNTPDASPVFAALGLIQDIRLAHLLQELKTACVTTDAANIKPFEKIVEEGAIIKE